MIVARSARAHGASIRPRREGMRQNAVVGGPLIVRTASLLITFLVATRLAARIGDDEVAAHQVAFQVFHEGRLALRSANAPALPMVDSGERFLTGFKTVQIDGIAWRVFAAHGAERDVQVYVGEQVTSRASILWAILRSTLWPMLVALPLLALAAWWAVHRGVAPLRRLGHTLAQRQPHALQPVIVDRAPSEMTPMLDALNGLLERIAGLLESERRFTADAAHELRTPIAAIRTQAQVALGEADGVTGTIAGFVWPVGNRSRFFSPSCR
jgi:signal transduction histidine kinase